MYVMRYLGLSILAGIVGALAGIRFYPDMNFVNYVLPVFKAGLVVLAVAVALSLWKEDDLSEQGKTILMSGLLVAVLGPTMFTAGAWAHGVQTSWSDGEIHYHADYEIIVQGEDGYEQLDLIDPSRFCDDAEQSYMCTLNDRTGEKEYHEHNDRRIHLEGTFKTKEHATLQAFFHTFGGELTNERLVYPTNDRVYNITEEGNRTLKIAVQKGVGGSRGWCMIGEPGAGLEESDICTSPYGGDMVTQPNEYIVSPYQQGPIDILWIVYDDSSASEVLADLREDGSFMNYEIEKSGEGY